MTDDNDAPAPPAAHGRIKVTLDAETRPFWDAVQRAKAEVDSWPAWKRGEREATTMDRGDDPMLRMFRDAQAAEEREANAFDPERNPLDRRLAERAQTCLTLRVVLGHWRHGEMARGEALTHAVELLADDAETMRALATRATMYDATPPTIVLGVDARDLAAALGCPAETDAAALLVLVGDLRVDRDECRERFNTVVAERDRATQDRDAAREALRQSEAARAKATAERDAAMGLSARVMGVAEARAAGLSGAEQERDAARARVAELERVLADAHAEEMQRLGLYDDAAVAPREE